MRRLHARLAAACTLAVAIAVVTSGAAVAGGGHDDHGNGNGQAQAQPQQQQAQQGMKPSSTTDHWTKTKVGSSPDVSKRYGNGKTAAQIAKSKGASDDADLIGPGNSQPHKISDCRHKSNKSGGVDVHAFKGAATCETAVQPQKHEVQKHEEQKHEVQKHEVKAAIVQAPAAVSVHKVTLCHATGSSTNPFVLITVDFHALKAGHTGAKGDIIPPTTINGVTFSANWDSNGQAIFNNGCKPVAAQAPLAPAVPAPTTTTPPPTTTQAEAPVTTTTEQAATVTVTTPATVTSTVAATTTTAAAQAPATATTTSAGGVLGAQTRLAPPKSNGGVLGTVGNIAGSSLPFTGFPVWLAVLVAFALVLAGIALRRRTLGSRP